MGLDRAEFGQVTDGLFLKLRRTLMTDDVFKVDASDLKILVEQLIVVNAQAMDALLKVSQQAAAGSLVNALLVRELGRAGSIDAIALRAEALARAELLGPAVAAAVHSIFGGEPPCMPDVPQPRTLAVIRGGLADT